MQAGARLFALVAALGLATSAWGAAPDRATILDTMKRATRYMTEQVAYRGGYVWSYLPDRSRRWGEIEAYPTMVWVQPPGTATMGHLFLDAYHATGDELYYQAAAKAAGALVAGQRPEGGWNYFIDFAGPASTKRWYETIGKNAWRMEEFQHDWNNSTFDDAGTSEAMQLLLRIYLEKREKRWRAPLDRAIGFVLKSQYANGGWPQRFPLRRGELKPGHPDYTSYITFNDDVADQNIRFLLMVHETLGDRRALPAIRRAMEIFVATQQASPQAGWGLQHDPVTLKPLAARTYEPLALATHTTAANVRQLINFYRMTGDPRFIARVPEALRWLESVRSPDGLAPRGRTHPTFVEIGTNRPLYVHRRGSNVVNGEYYADHDPQRPIGHYSAFRNVDVARLRRDYEQARATPVAELLAASPLRRRAGGGTLPRHFVAELDAGSDLNAGTGEASAEKLVASLNGEGWWPTPLEATSNPYAGDGPVMPAPGDFATTHVGDRTDTSPYVTDKPVTGLSVSTFIRNMEVLIRAIGPS